MSCRFENSETLRMLSEKIPLCAQSSQRRMIKVAVLFSRNGSKLEVSDLTKINRAVKNKRKWWKITGD